MWIIFTAFLFHHVGHGYVPFDIWPLVSDLMSICTGGIQQINIPAAIENNLMCYDQQNKIDGLTNIWLHK